MKKVLFFLMFAFAGYISNAQQFVKTYKALPGCSSQGGSLTFNCISKAIFPSLNFYIAGMQDSSVYVAEVDPNGIIVREKLIDTKLRGLLPHTMITDNGGNLVIVGDIKTSAASPLTGFMMKISSALSLIFEMDYHAINTTNSLSLSDVKDANGDYYVCGTTTLPGAASNNDVLLMRVDQSNGTVVVRYSGQPTALSGYDGYDALNISEDDHGFLPNVSATGRLSSGGNTTFRPWINNHNFINLSFTQGHRYIKDLNERAQLYSSSLIEDNTDLLTCWNGNAGLKPGGYVDIGLMSVNRTTLIRNFIKQYFITSPKPQNEILLKAVKTDVVNGGYVNEGFWWARNTDAYGRAVPGNLFLLKVDNNGNPIWGRQFKDILVNFYSHNSEFVVDGNFIYAVGFKDDPNKPGNYSGALIKIPANNGAMDTACADTLRIDATSQTFDAADRLQPLDIIVPQVPNDYAINCLQTQTEIKCNEPCENVFLNADFDLTGRIVAGNTATFTVTASNFDNIDNSQWIVSDVTSGIPTFVEHDFVGGAWSMINSTNFGGYFGNMHINMGSTTFYQQHKYRFQHILSRTNHCAITTSDTVTKVIYMGASFKGGNGNFIIINEKGGKQNAGNNAALSASKINAESKTTIYPNPADQSITLNLNNLHVANPVVQIFSANGQSIQTTKIAGTQQNLKVAGWAAGSYTYKILSGGKIIDTGKFIVQH